MATEFNFKSQIATSREQSEELLALGLKKETTDCYWWQENDQYGDGNGKWHLEVLDTKEAREHFEYLDKFFDDELFIPAWSLHRLIEILDTNPCVFYTNCGYDNIIDRIEEYIKEGIMDARYMNEGYLEEE